MRTLLHILTKSDDPLAVELISRQKMQAVGNVQVIDLTQPEPNYEVLLEAIFEADSIQVW